MTQTIPYLKMNGLGNDFVVVDNRQLNYQFLGNQIRAIANRENGIGCDQFIIMDKAPKDADIFMRIYNHDGGEVEACGNATRCIASLLAKETGKQEVIVATSIGLLPSYVDDEIVSVDMGAPLFAWDKIPLSEEFNDTRGIELQIGPIDNPVLHTPAVVNVGNPHAVFFVENDPDDYDLELFGPMLENHPIFPERANISIAQITAPNVIKLRVWERGVGLTKACGTAACATAVCAARLELTLREVAIDLPGGRLFLEWQDEDDHIIMAGPFENNGSGIIPNHLLET
jgi:diaminopimelate epimerase